MHAYVGWFQTGIFRIRVTVRSSCDLGHQSRSQKVEQPVGYTSVRTKILGTLVLTHYRRVTDRQTDTPLQLNPL